MSFFTKLKKRIPRQDLEKELARLEKERDEILKEYVKISTLLNQTRRELQSAEKEAVIFRVGIVDIIKRSSKKNSAAENIPPDFRDVEPHSLDGANESFSTIQDDSSASVDQETQLDDKLYKSYQAPDQNCNIPSYYGAQDHENKRFSASQNDDKSEGVELDTYPPYSIA